MEKYQKKSRKKPFFEIGENPLIKNDKSGFLVRKSELNKPNCDSKVMGRRPKKLQKAKILRKKCFWSVFKWRKLKKYSEK